MKLLIKSLLVLSFSLLFSSLDMQPLYSQSTDQQTTWQQKSEILKLKLIEALDLLKQSNQEIANLQLELTTAKQSQTISSEKILQLENQLNALKIMQFDQLTQIDELNKSLASASISSTNLEKINHDIQIENRCLQIKNRLLIGGCIVAFVGGVTAGIYSYKIGR